MNQVLGQDLLRNGRGGSDSEVECIIEDHRRSKAIDR